MRRVEVLWADCYSHCESPWIGRDELDKAATGDSEIFTVGYVFKEDDRNLTLTMSHHPDDLTEVGMAITIPKPMILEVRQLSPASVLTSGRRAESLAANASSREGGDLKVATAS